ncbi:MAG: hypothetical protein AAFR84_21960 [Pseudomonadota bacterium]
MRKLHAGLDVSLKVMSLCVVGENDATVLEAKALSELDAITEALQAVDGERERVSLATARRPCGSSPA